MIKFKKLFSFSKKEIDHFWPKTTLKKRTLGLKLLQAASDQPKTEPAQPGKLLIVTPRRMGKACQRNRLRRQVKEIFFQEKLFEKPVISILIAGSNAVNLNFDELKKFLIESI